MLTLFLPGAKPNIQFSSLSPHSTFRMPVEVRVVTVGQLFFIDYPKANLGKKEYFRDGFLEESNHLYSISFISPQ